MAIAKPKVHQFRFYAIGNEHNEPTISNASDLVVWQDGSLFNDYGSIVKIGIQTLPGTKFSIGEDLSNTITIDHTGVYELDLRNISAVISSIVFDSNSLAMISSIDNASLIVDILYYSEGAVSAP